MQLIKSFLLVLCALTNLLFGINLVTANSIGLAGYSGNPSHNNGLNCSTASGCHVGGIPPTVIIQGPKIVKTGSTNHYKLILRNGQDSIGGVNISSDSGALKRKDIETVVDPSSLEIIHISPPKKVLDDGTTITWLFDWTAPAIASSGSPSIIYAALVSANNDSAVTVDSTKTIIHTVDVVSELLTTNFAPVAKIIAPFTAKVGDAFLLNGSSSSVEDGFILKYKWSFSDNSKEIFKEQTLKSFNTTGLYTIFLTVTSNKPETQEKIETSTSYFDIFITDQFTGLDSKLVPNANISAPRTGLTDSAVTFSANVANSINEYIWDFGDSNIIPKSPDPSIIAVNIPTISHVYTATGTYIVTLAVKGINDLVNIDSFEITIVDGTGAANDVATGKQLYTDTDNNPLNTNCTGAACHGIGGLANGIIKNIQGATELLINQSVANVNNVPVSMVTRIDNIKTIDLNGTQKVADYLGSIVYPTQPIPTDIEKGKLLYEVRCLLCHGLSAQGVLTRGRNIQGANQALILDAISQVVSISPPKNAIPLMKGIKLTSAEATIIELYLATLLPTGGNFLLGEKTFRAKCYYCHGTGTGGQAKNIINTTIANIDNGLINQTAMRNTKLTAADKLNLVTFLTGNSLITPTTGADLYQMYCSYCHGVDAKGGNVAEISIQGKGFKGKDIMDAYKTGDIPIMSNSNLQKVIELNSNTLSLIANYIDQLGNGE